MRRAFVLALLAATLVIDVIGAVGRHAQAQPADDVKSSYRVSLDRVDYEPASITGTRVRVYLSATSLQGQILDLTDPKQIRLFVGTSERKLPFALGAYSASADTETDIMVLVQATADFTDALPQIADSLEHVLLDHLKESVKVAIVTYGAAASPPKLVAVKTVRGKVALATDNSVTDPVLLDGVDRALVALKKAKPELEGRPQRKMIVVIGDGRDADADRDRVTRTATRAAKEGVRIHTLAYSPADLRRPLLVLGELSKKSFGTLRWPGQGRKPLPETWNDSFKQLGDEINKQYVLTFFAGAPGSGDDLGGKRLHIVTSGRTEATSNELKIPEAPSCSGNPCDSGYCADDACVAFGGPKGSRAKVILRWVLIVAGIVVGALVLLAFIGWILTKREHQAQLPHHPVSAGAASPPPHLMNTPAMAAASQHFAVQQGLLQNGRPIPGLLVMTGPRTGERLTLRNGFLIGGLPASDLAIHDGYTSGNHAQFTMDPEGNCMVVDLGSTNGTFINGQRIQSSPLNHGMTIKVGATEFRFLTQ
ncbi:hypothetical protein BH11MYX1_BH11MYX1_31920 [soil metagenome]